MRTITLGDRTYDVAFTPAIYREAENAIGRPLLQVVQRERALTVDQTASILWAIVRRQHRTLTVREFNTLVNAYLNSGHTTSELQLPVIEALFDCEFIVPRSAETDEDGAEARPTPAPTATEPTEPVVP